MQCTCIDAIHYSQACIHASPVAIELSQENLVKIHAVCGCCVISLILGDSGRCGTVLVGCSLRARKLINIV